MLKMLNNRMQYRMDELGVRVSPEDVRRLIQFPEDIVEAGHKISNGKFDWYEIHDLLGMYSCTWMLVKVVDSAEQAHAAITIRNFIINTVASVLNGDDIKFEGGSSTEYYYSIKEYLSKTLVIESEEDYRVFLDLCIKYGSMSLSDTFNYTDVEHFPYAAESIYNPILFKRFIPMKFMNAYKDMKGCLLSGDIDSDAAILTLYLYITERDEQNRTDILNGQRDMFSVFKSVPVPEGFTDKSTMKDIIKYYLENDLDTAAAIPATWLHKYWMEDLSVDKALQYLDYDGSNEIDKKKYGFARRLAGLVQVGSSIVENRVYKSISRRLKDIVDAKSSDDKQYLLEVIKQSATSTCLYHGFNEYELEAAVESVMNNKDFMDILCDPGLKTAAGLSKAVCKYFLTYGVVNELVDSVCEPQGRVYITNGTVVFCRGDMCGSGYYKHALDEYKVRQYHNIGKYVPTAMLDLEIETRYDKVSDEFQCNSYTGLHSTVNDMTRHGELLIDYVREFIRRGFYYTVKDLWTFAYGADRVQVDTVLKTILDLQPSVIWKGICEIFTDEHVNMFYNRVQSRLDYVQSEGKFYNTHNILKRTSPGAGPGYYEDGFNRIFQMSKDRPVGGFAALKALAEFK